MKRPTARPTPIIEPVDDWRPWWLRALQWCLSTWYWAGVRREQEWKEKEAMARLRWAKALNDLEQQDR